MHIIIFDEIDAICKQRGSMAGSTGVHDTVVNQLLSKIDGVEQLNNILVIGMWGACCVQRAGGTLLFAHCRSAEVPKGDAAVLGKYCCFQQFPSSVLIS